MPGTPSTAAVAAAIDAIETRRTPAIASDGGVDPSSLDTMFDTLADRRRRRVLALVLEHDPAAGTGLAVEAIVDRLVGDRDRERFATALHHVHLPRLEATGYVDWDREAGTVGRGPEFDLIAPLLRILADHGDELPGGWP